jgi:hypothetical protein
MMQTDREGIDEPYEDAMGASKATRLVVLIATDGNSTSAGQGNTDLRLTAWINDAARLAQVIREHFKRRRPLRHF